LAFVTADCFALASAAAFSVSSPTSPSLDAAASILAPVLSASVIVGS
jgi:hypothetical protein